MKRKRSIAIAAAGAIALGMSAAAGASAATPEARQDKQAKESTVSTQSTSPSPARAEYETHCLDAVPTGPEDYQEAFDHRTGGWAGADGAWPIVLPDDRVLWLFGDSFIGEVNENNALEPGWRLVISVQVQDGACFTPMTGGTTEAPESFFPNEDGLLHWPGGGYVDTSGPEPVVRVIAVGVVPGTLGEPEANRVFTLSLPELELISIDDMPNDVTAGDPNLASNVLHDGDTVYLYGNRVGSDDQNVARAPADSIVNGPYEYWTGDGWSEDASQAGPIEYNDPEGPGNRATGRVIPWGDGYMMSGKLGELWVFTDELYAWYSDSPAGPWTIVEDDNGEPKDIGQHPGFPQSRWIYGGYLATDIPGSSPEEPIVIFSTNGAGCEDDGGEPCTPDNDVTKNVYLYGPHLLNAVGLPPQ